MGRALNPNPTGYRLTIGNERGDMRLRRQARGMTYHHILPFNVLRDFWNEGAAHDLEQLRETLVPRLMRSMGAYAIDRTDPDKAAALVSSAEGLLRMIWMGNYVHALGGP